MLAQQEILSLHNLWAGATNDAAVALLPHGDSASAFCCQQSKCCNSSWVGREKDDPSVMSDVIICCFHMAPYNLLYLKYVFQSV